MHLVEWPLHDTYYYTHHCLTTGQDEGLLQLPSHVYGTPGIRPSLLVSTQTKGVSPKLQLSWEDLQHQQCCLQDSEAP